MYISIIRYTGLQVDTRWTGIVHPSVLHIPRATTAAMGAALVLFIGPGVNKCSDARHGVFFPKIGVAPSSKTWFSGLPCKQIILDIAPVFLSDYVTDN